MAQAQHLYAIGLGSNRRHGRHGGPEPILRAAADALGEHGTLRRLSPIISSAPLGPSRRRYANAAALLETPLAPPELLAALKAIERRFGRRPGIRWGARVLDLDILLWSGEPWRDKALTIPHAALADRRFVLQPLVQIAPGWRLPGTGLNPQHLLSRLTKPVPIHRSRTRWVRSSVGRASDF